MVLIKTRRKAKLAIKGFIYDRANLHEVIEVRRKNALEDSMGFRGQWEEHRRFQVAFLHARGLKPSHRLLEIGCGPLTAGLPLIEYLDSNKYFGIDIRNSVLDMAWREVGRAKLSAKNPRLIQSSTFGAEEIRDERFDFVLSFSVLFHLTNSQVAQFFAQVAKVLMPSGACYAQVNTHLDDSRWLQFPFVRRCVADYRIFAEAGGLELTALGPLESLGFRLAAEERLNEMLLFTLRRTGLPSRPQAVTTI